VACLSQSPESLQERDYHGPEVSGTELHDGLTRPTTAEDSPFREAWPGPTS